MLNAATATENAIAKNSFVWHGEIAYEYHIDVAAADINVITNVLLYFIMNSFYVKLYYTKMN
jgi:hypothetical protein